jgi:hypothetical protein
MGQWTVRVHVLCGLNSTRHVPMKAHVGAEKSRLTRRRKRGLRKGKRRSRECHSRRSAPPATAPKPQSSRKVNHVGRKFIWALIASNRFRVACKKYLSVSKRYRTDSGPPSRAPGYRKSLTVWWQHLADRAKLAGIPYQAAFHDSWWNYMRIEVHDGVGDGWDSLLAVLPRKGSPPPTPREGADGKRPVGDVTARHDEYGNSLRVEPDLTRKCKKCQGFGASPGIGYPFGCSSCYAGHPRYRRRKLGAGSSALRRG